MTAVFVPAPPVNQPLAGPDGRLSRAWRGFFLALYNRGGGAADKVEAAHGAALAAAPAATQVVAVGGLHTGGDLTANVAVSLYRAISAVAALPPLGNTEGDWAYALDGRKPGESAGAGSGAPCFWSSGQWIAVTSGVAVTA